jgi:conjugative relaxase-like TrwC/TraI family protein
VQLLAEGRAEALQVAIGYLERHGIGVRRDHNGTDRYQAVGGLVAVAFEHRMSRAGDPNSHTHVLVQNAAQGPDGRWTALDSDRLYAHLMAADHLYLAAERAALTQRLGVRWGPVDERSGAAEIIGLDDRTLIERFSKRSEQIDQWLDSHGLSGIKASSAAAVATTTTVTAHATTADLYLFLWGRRRPTHPGLTVTGDNALLTHWQQHAVI